MLLTHFKVSSQNFEWGLSIGGAGVDNSTDIVADNQGNSYVTGFFEGTVDFDPGVGVSNLTSAGGQDIFVSKLDSLGTLVWVKRIGGLSNDQALSISLSSAGALYITGFYGGSVDFDPGPSTFTLNSISGTSDQFVCKISNSGTFIWAKSMGGTGIDNGYSISIDNLGNVITTGIFEGISDFDPNSGTNNLISNGFSDIFISKLDSNGNFLWARSIGGMWPDFGSDVSTDETGNVILVGRFADSVDFDPGPGSFILSASSFFYDLFILKLDPNGAFRWANSFGGETNESANSVVTDDLGNSYLTGTYFDTIDFDPGPGSQLLFPFDGSIDIFVLKLDSNGSFVWVKGVGGNSLQSSSSISLDPKKNLFVTGYFLDTVDFDPGFGSFFLNPVSSGFADPYVLKLDSNGNFLHAQSFGGGGWDEGRSIFSFGPNKYVLTGQFESNADLNPCYNGNNVISNGFSDVFVSKFSSITPPDIPSIISSSDTICKGETVTLSINTGNLNDADHWQWYSGGCSVNPIGIGDSITVIPDTSTTYFVRGEGGCVIPFTCSSKRLYVDDAPTTANAGFDIDSCAVQIVLNANSISIGSGTWTQLNGAGALTFGNINDPNTLVDIIGFSFSSDTFQLEWTSTNGVCPASSDTVQVVFHQNPTVPNAGLDNQVCDSLVLLNGNLIAVGSGTWSEIGSSRISFSDPNVSNPFANIVLGAGEASVSVSLAYTTSNGTCPSLEDTVDIVFSQVPDVPIAGPDDSICGLSYTMGANPVSIGNATWSMISGPGILNFNNTTDPNTGVTAALYGIYRIAWTNSNGTCPAVYDSIDLEFVEQPSISNAGIDQLICDTVFQLAGNTPLVGSPSWVEIGTARLNFSNASDPNSTANLSFLPGEDSVVLNLEYQISNSICPINSDTVQITAYQSPTPPLAGPDQQNCSNNTNLTGNTPLVGIGTWTQNAGPGIANFGNQSLPNSTVQVAAQGTYELVWTISNGTCPNSTDTVFIEFNLPPMVTAGNDTSICLGQAIVLSGSGANTYAWDQGVTNGVAFNPSATSTYTVVGTGNGNCTDTASINVTVNALPQPALGPDTVLCFDESISLDPGAGFASYNWNTGATTQSIVVDSSAGAGIYWVQVSDNNQCSNTDSVFVDFTICTGIDLAGLGNTRIFPIPTREKLFIEFEYKVNAILHLIDEKGSTVIKGRIEGKNKELNLEKFSPGVYILRIQQNSYDYSLRIVKK